MDIVDEILLLDDEPLGQRKRGKKATLTQAEADRALKAIQDFTADPEVQKVFGAFDMLWSDDGE